MTLDCRAQHLGSPMLRPIGKTAMASGEPRSRLLTFFNCGMPFEYLEPYTTIAGAIHLEIFCGRRREIECWFWIRLP